MNRTATAALAVTFSLLAAGSASADTRSWTAVKKFLGKSDTVVVGIDLARLRTTTAYQQGMTLFLDSEPDAKQVFAMVKDSCGFDVMTSVSDITVVMQEGGDHPLISFGLDGIDEAKVVACLGLVAGKMTDMPGVTLTGKKLGKITEYSVKGEKKKLYAAWLAKDVLTFTDDANDRKKLEKRLAGKGAKGDLAKFIGRTSTAAPFWFAVAKREKEDGRLILGGHGKLDLAGGLFKAAGAIVMSKPAEATEMVTEGTEGLAKAKAEIGTQSPALLKALNTVTMTAAGAEVVITGSIADKDIATIVPQLESLF